MSRIFEVFGSELFNIRLHTSEYAIIEGIGTSITIGRSNEEQKAIKKKAYVYQGASELLNYRNIIRHFMSYLFRRLEHEPLAPQFQFSADICLPMGNQRIQARSSELS